jgi:20S proteasome alpha/beta subunit
MLEAQDNSFFYQKETMGTTIMAVKYEGGVIVCADSRSIPP